MLLLLLVLGCVALLLLQLLCDSSFTERLFLHTPVHSPVGGHGKIVGLHHFLADAGTHLTLLLKKAECLVFNQSLQLQAGVVGWYIRFASVPGANIRGQFTELLPARHHTVVDDGLALLADTLGV